MFKMINLLRMSRDKQATVRLAAYLSLLAFKYRIHMIHMVHNKSIYTEMLTVIAVQ